MNNQTLDRRLEIAKRRYKSVLEDLKIMVQKELEVFGGDRFFEPSSGLDSAALHLIQEANRLKSLLEVDPQSNADE